MSNIQAISSDIYGQREQFSRVLSDQSINFDAEAEFAIQILEANSFAMGVATKNRQSVINAVNNVAAIGISLNPAKKEAYLVPRDGKICLDISYMGLIALATATGSIVWAQAKLVYEGDQFELVSVDSAPIHKCNPFLSAEKRGAIVGAYVVAKTTGGDYLTECMSLEEIQAVQAQSAAGMKGPWKNHFGEMAKKTVLKRAAKYWPRNDRLDNAIHYLNTDGGEGLQDAKIQQAERTITEVQAKALTDLAAQCSPETMEKFKKAHPDVMTIAVSEYDKIRAQLKKRADQYAAAAIDGEVVSNAGN